MTNPKIRKRQDRRLQTEAALIESFETILLRNGARAITAAAIAEEAGVAKTLIYKYFTNVVGLIKTWGVRREIFIKLQDLFPDAESAAQNLAEDPFEFAKTQILMQAAHLRQNPILLEIMLAELVGTGPVVQAMKELRKERNMAESMMIGQDLSEDNLELTLPVMLMPAAVSYLALRARHAPTYFGSVQLDNDDDWQDMMGAVEQVMDLLKASHQTSKKSNKTLKRKRMSKD